MFWRRKKIDEVAVFFVTLIVKIIYSIFDADISLISDHLGQIAIASEIAGNGWDNLVSSETWYYGWGFNWIFAIVFKCTDNPYIIYSAINILFSVTIAIGSWLLYRTAKRFDTHHHAMYALLVIGLGITTATGYGSTPILYFVNGVVAYVAARLFESNKKLGWSIALAFLVVYSVAIHQKNMFMICAATCCVLFAILVCKRKRDYIREVCLPYFISLGLSYFIFIRLKEIVIASVWASADGQIKNSTMIRGDMFWFTKDIVEAVNLCFQCLISNIYTLCNNTYGIGAVIIVVFIFAIIEIFISLGKKQKRLSTDIISINSLIVGFGLIAVLIMAGLAFDGARGVFSGNYNNYINWTYNRYYISYAQVLIILALCYFFKQTYKKKSIILALSAGIYLVSFLHFQFISLPTLVDAQDLAARNIKLNSAWLVDFGNNSINGKIFVILFGCVFFVLLKQKKEMVIGVVCLVISVLKIGAFPNMQIPNSSACGAIYELYEKIGMDELPTKIYTDSSRRYTLQFMLNRKSVFRGFPEADEVIYFFHKKDVETPEGYVQIQLDSNEWIYVKGIELQEKIYAVLDKSDK